MPLQLPSAKTYPKYLSVYQQAWFEKVREKKLRERKGMRERRESERDRRKSEIAVTGKPLNH